MVSRPLEVIVAEMLQQIQAVLPEANIQPGSVIRETFINSPAAQISLLSDSVESVRTAQTIATATGTDLDGVAGNYGLVRDPGQPAVGQVTLVFTDNIASNSISVRDGTIVSTSEQFNTTDFSIIGSFTFNSVNKDSYAAEARRLSSQLSAAGISNAKYVATVPVVAVQAGSNGNVAAFSVVRANISGIKNVVNLIPTVGGTDIESDTSLRRRISLVLSGSNTGTADGLIAIALANPNVTDATVIRPGNVLMTRDGSVYDADGNLVKEGTGRDVDLYIRGIQYTSSTESFTFTDNSQGASISTANNLVLGYDTVTASNIFAKQPIGSLLDVSGSVSGANFKAGVEVADEEGNVILEGNYILLKDYIAGQYSIVVDNETGGLKVASYLSPINTRYTVIKQLESSDNANSALGLDSILWLTNVATIDEEAVVRGTEFNGADMLAHSGIAQILSVEEDVIFTKESIVIGTQGLSQDAFVIYTKHIPVMSVDSVRHSRLGYNYDFEILDASIGKIRLIGRHAPQSNDIIQVTYTWRQEHLQNVEYYLQGDNVKWLREPYETSPANGTTLLASTTLNTTNILDIQPLTPTYLALQMSQLTARGRYNLTVLGDKARIITGERISMERVPSFETSNFVFKVNGPQSSTASQTRLGRVLSVRNLSRGFEYSLENMALNTNVYDPAVHVESNLANNEFMLDMLTNTEHLSVGDKLKFSRLSLLKHWTTTNDFTNNINGNTSPTYDPIITNIANDEVTVKRHEDDRSSPVTTIAGFITAGGTLSGMVDVVGDLVIELGATIILQPNTTIRVRDRRSLNTVEAFKEQVRLDNVILDTDIATANPGDIKNVYVFQRPTGTTAPFFVILNTLGTESRSIYYDRDVIVKVRSDLIGGPPYLYYIRDVIIPDEFISGPLGLEAAMTSVPATFLGYRKLELDASITFVSKMAIISGRSQYGIYLQRTPRTTGLATDDFSFYQASNPDAIFTDISYDSEHNVFLVDGLAVQDDYGLGYYVSVVNRITIRVRGVLQTSPDVDENNPVVFTSSATNPEPGDWEGIIFEPSSRTGAPGNAFVTSYLTNTTVKYARIGIQNDTSDPLIDRCLIKNCSDTAYSVTSSYYKLSRVNRSDLRLLSNDFSPGGRSYAENRNFDEGYGYGYGYGGVRTSTRTLSLPITNLLTTAIGKMPGLAKVGLLSVVPGTDVAYMRDFESKYVSDLVLGTDYAVYVDDSPITSVNADFAIEFDRRLGGYVLSFFNTELTRTFIASLGVNPGIVTIDYYAAYGNGTIQNSILAENGNAAVDIDNTAFVTLRNNTIHGDGFYGVTIHESYAVVSNNLITGYFTAPILHDNMSVVSITTNDMWSLPIINIEQNEVADIDKLVLAISATDTILTVETPSLYKRNSVIKIDDEFMQVQDTLGNNISVTRGFNDTTPASHKANADIIIQRTKVVFTIGGVLGKYCQIREVTSDGSIIANRVPVDMSLIAPCTFRTSFTVDRSSTFFYRFQYKEELSDLYWTLSETRRLFSYQFGSAVNAFFNPYQEVGLVVGSLDETNYSDNPKYGQPDVENFLIPTSSPASASNPIYATPYNPAEPRLRFLGKLPKQQEVNLLSGTTTIILSATPVVVTSLQTDVIVQLASNTSRRLGVASYDDSTKTLRLATPVASSDVGTYQVIYNTAVTLGSPRSPFPLTTSLVYIYDESRVVDFTKLDWEMTGGSGLVEMRFRVANSVDQLSAQTYSAFISEQPFDLSFGTNNYPRGSVIQFEVLLGTNDSGFTDGTPIFPKLEDMSLYLTPAQDNVLYSVLGAVFDTRNQETLVTIEDSERQGQGIRDTTFQTIGEGEVLSANVTKVDGTKFTIGEIDPISIGQTVINVKDDVIIERSAPTANDEIVVDYIYVDVGDNEVVTFIENGTQVTQGRFFHVTSATPSIVVDKVIAQPTSEILAINSTVQPTPGTQYLVSYMFAAPVDGETIIASYTYNNVVQQVAQTAEARRVLTSDVLVRAGYEVPIHIEANILVANGFNPSSVIVDITNALSLYFTTFTGFGGTVRLSDIQATMSSASGVNSVAINILSRTAAATVGDVVFNEREYVTLAPSNPILTIAFISDPSQVVATNSV